MLDEMSTFYNHWETLQQPAHPGQQGIHAAYRALLSAIDQGWQVESIGRKASGLRTDVGYYLFVLRCGDLGLTRHFMIPAAPEVEAFIQNNGYRVN